MARESALNKQASMLMSRGPSRERKRQIRRNNFRRFWMLYPLLFLCLSYFVIFNYFPMYGIQLAFRKYTVRGGISGSAWIGFENFRRVFSREPFWRAFRNTLIISLMKTIVGFPMPILLAILVNELRSNKLAKGLQIIYTLPHFLSWVTISGIIIKLLSSNGAINTLIMMNGGERVAFMNNGDLFRWILVFTDIWKESGWTAIIYMAAIAGIDPTLYESARVDGANRFQRAIYITLPSIIFTAGIMLLLAIGGVMNGNFEQIFNLYNPNVFDKADIIDTYIYRITFLEAADYGISTAVGMFKGVINFILLVSANLIVRRFNRNASLF